MQNKKTIRIEQTNGRERVIGTFYSTNKTFVSKRQKSKHLFRKNNSWAIDANAFKNMLNMYELEVVKIIDTEENIEYTAKVEDFMEHGKKMKFYPYRLQIFLPLQYWNKK